MSEEKYYTFEIYQNGDLIIVLRSDDPAIIKMGEQIHCNMGVNIGQMIKQQWRIKNELL